MREECRAWGTRTPDLLVRSQTLYPTELRARSVSPSAIPRCDAKLQLCSPAFVAHVAQLSPAPKCQPWESRRRGRGCQSLDSNVLANKESASTRSAISVVAYQLSSQLPVYEDRLNSSPLDKTVVETNLSTVFDRLFAEPLKDPVPIADKPQAILIDALDEATRNGSNELAWLIGGELQRMPRGCAKIPLSFEVDRYNGQPANNRLNLYIYMYMRCCLRGAARNRWTQDNGRDELGTDRNQRILPQLPFSQFSQTIHYHTGN